MHPALKVPEILCLIFGHDFTRYDLFNCSLVCRLWGIWAQDVLLRTEHVSLQAVLQPLAPITRSTYQYRDIPCLEIGNIEEPDWCRFSALSNKLTKLAIDCTLRYTSLEHINYAKQKFGGALFGQLEALHTVAEGVQLDTISLVAVPSLKSAFLSCYTLPSDDLIWVANAMPVMAPNIVRLGITLSTSNRELEMSRYSALKHLELRNEHILPQLWESLANCQLLTKVVLTWCNKVEKRWGNWSTPYVEIGNIEKTHWRRFLVQSNKITSLMIDCNIGRSSLQRIRHAKSKFGGDLFGQLKTIKTNVRLVRSETIELVTVPSLNAAILSNIQFDETRAWVGDNMPGMAPNVAHLVVNWTSKLELSRYLALEHLELRSRVVRRRFWDSLASCPLLKKIVLTGCFIFDSVESDQSANGDVGFVSLPELHTLKLRLGRPGPILLLVLCTRMPKLECLWWDLPSGPGPLALDRIVPQLKLYSPKVDTDMLYHLNTDNHGHNPTDIGNDYW
ncbi:hypothetical protein FS837_009266 [Tulasnella sp. UAMH 9824]|nr:hypothetical protein FS837_009266 [Tulasnella sp. UAMH 9824]